MKLKLENAVEALLFVAAEPMTTQQLAKLTDSDLTEVEAAVKRLNARLESSGLSLTRRGSEVTLTTAPTAGAILERFFADATRADLSAPALETLAIVAYRQPVTKAEIDRLRGVASEQTVKGLLLRGLIAESGRADLPGRPIQYGTTVEFQQQLGLTDLSQLPALSEVEVEQSS